MRMRYRPTRGFRWLGFFLDFLRPPIVLILSAFWVWGQTFPVFIFLFFGLFLGSHPRLVLAWGLKREGQLCPFFAQSICTADPPTTTKVIITTIRQKWTHSIQHTVSLRSTQGRHNWKSPPVDPALLDYLSGHSAKKKDELASYSSLDQTEISFLPSSSENLFKSRQLSAWPPFFFLFFFF